MTLVKTSSEIVDISGKGPSGIFYRDKSGLHCRSAIPSRDRPSTVSIARRGAFSKALNLWKSHDWSTAELCSWDNWIARHPRTNRVGSTYFLSRYQAFMRFNIIRAYNNIDPAFIAPLD